MYYYICFLLLCPGQDIKKLPSCVRLDNRKVLRAQGPRKKYSERFFCRLINYTNYTNCIFLTFKKCLTFCMQSIKVYLFSFNYSLEAKKV